MYQGNITLIDATTPDGWTIKSMDDVILALLAFPYFQTVATPFIVEAIQQSIKDRREYENITDLAQHIAENYI